MRQINMSDMRKRLDGLQKTINSENMDLSKIDHLVNGAHTVARNGRPADIMRFLENAKRSNINLPFSIYMEIFDSIIEHGNVSQINKVGMMLEDNFVARPRDAKEMQVILKRRLTRTQRKVKDNITNSVENNIADSLPQAISPNIASSGSEPTANTEAAIKVYNKMLESAVIYENCDRVIENYNRISKRFNIDKLFYENVDRNGLYDTVIELCSKIDTYNIPNSIKFNTVIETAWYGLETNHIEYKKSTILEAAIDYFSFKSGYVSDVKQILETTLFYDKNDDMKDIDMLMEEESEKEEPRAYDSIPSMIEGYLGLERYKQTPLKESGDFNELFKKYKEEQADKEDKHPESKLRSLVSKLYAKDIDNVVDGTPNLLNYIRSFFIIGTGAIPIIGPILMIIGFIADKFISLGKDKEETEKMVKCFNAEIKKSKTKLETLEDPEEKKRMEEYIKSLKKAKDKVEQYQMDILTDKEIDDKYANMDTDDFDDDDDSFKDIFDADDLDFDMDDLMKEACIKLAEVSEELVELNKNGELTADDVKYAIDKLSNDDLNNFAVAVKTFPEVFHKDAFARAIDMNIEDIKDNRNNGFETLVSKSLRLQTLEGILSDLNLDEKEYYNEFKKLTVFESLKRTEALLEASQAISIIANSKDYTLLEASISNKLKMASMKLRNAFTKLSDKDRQVSKSLDLTMNNFKKSVERALTNDNRESIIKGSILPSFSKIVKLAITTGLVCLVNPTLAVIGAIGYLGCSAKFKSKERQMLTDEIEIELKMCEKYIDIAEQKNDMKALKQLLMIQRDLQRQHQRIKYKMKMQMGQKYYDAKSVGEDN